jgi:membrane-associated phospholipid phosphatase
MLESLINLDHSLFQLINKTWSNGVFDSLMPVITNKNTWIPLYILILVFFIYKFRKYAYIPVVCLALCVGAADYSTSGIIKPSVERTRPCNIQELEANILVSCRNSPSFPSSHAANHFAIAVFLMFFLKGKWKKLVWPFLIWAFFIAYSRVYVGVHFPIDISVGAAIGILLGIVFGKISIKLMHKFAPSV